MTEISNVSGISTLESDLLRKQTLIGQNGNPTSQALPAYTQASQEEKKPLTAEEKKSLQEATSHLNEVIKPLSIGLNIQPVDSSNNYYVELFDRDTGKVIREIPAREIIKMQEHIRQYQGLIFDKFS